MKCVTYNCDKCGVEVAMGFSKMYGTKCSKCFSKQETNTDELVDEMSVGCDTLIKTVNCNERNTQDINSSLDNNVDDLFKISIELSCKKYTYSYLNRTLNKSSSYIKRHCTKINNKYIINSDILEQFISAVSIV